MEIKNWRDLKIGQHVSLSCGCAGFIWEIHLTGHDESSVGFRMKFTRDCAVSKSRWGLRNSYSDGYGPYGNFFNYDLPEKSYPIFEVSAPGWWKNLEDGPDRKLQKLKAEHWRRVRGK